MLNAFGSYYAQNYASIIHQGLITIKYIIFPLDDLEVFKSFLDVGTLCQLCNVTDSRNIRATAPNNFNACDDFFVTVIQCHIVAAAMEHLGMKKQSDSPVHDLLKCDLWLEDKETRRHALEEVTKLISLSYTDILAHNDWTLDIELDQVKRYAVEVLSQGLNFLML